MAAAKQGWVGPSVLPGFGMTLGLAGVFLAAIVLIPMAALVIRGASLPPAEFWEIATQPRALASYRLTFGASLLAALINAVFGFIVAWCLVRDQFPGKRLVDAIIDLPFALPTAVSGIALATVFAPTGWVGQVARAARHPGRVYVGRCRRRAHADRLAVRRADPCSPRSRKVDVDVRGGGGSRSARAACTPVPARDPTDRDTRRSRPDSRSRSRVPSASTAR